MTAPRVRSDFDQLKSIAGQFNTAAETTNGMIQNLNSKLEQLRGKDWVGKGADKFIGEMDNSVLPSLKRLSKAMGSASRITNQIARIMKQAEDDATALFRGGAAGAGAAAGGAAGAGSSASDGGSGTGAGAGAGGAGGGSPSGGAGGSGGSGGSSGGAAGGSSGGAPGNPLLARDPNSLFTDDYMKSLVGSQFEGADSRALRNAMNTLAGNPKGAELDAALQQIADARGKPVSEIRADYEKFLQVKAQRDATNPDTPPDLFGHPLFMGSTSQLRYGKVVGDAFGMDPVFGSLLNPSGGLVGPGNAAVDGDSSAVGYHGQVHDAAGYLYNYHNAGPGYDYLGREGRDTSSPLSGQREGIRYWRDTLGGPSPVSTPLEYLARAGVWGIDKGSSVIDTIRSVF